MRTPIASVTVAMLAAALPALADSGTSTACEDNLVTAQDVKTRKDLKAFVECAAEYLAEHGTAEARRAFNEDRRWLTESKGQYIFVDTRAESAEESVTLVFPPIPSMEGMSFGSLVDDFGSDLIGEFDRILSDHDSGWAYYAFTNPETGVTEPKAAYIVDVDWDGTPALLGSGIYEPDLPGACAADRVNAAALEMSPSDEELEAFLTCAARLFEAMGHFAGPILERDPRWRHGSIYVFVVDPDTEEILYSGSAASFAVSGNVRSLFGGRDVMSVTVDFGEAFFYYDFAHPATGHTLRKVSFSKRVRVQGETFVVGSGYYLPGL